MSRLVAYGLLACLLLGCAQRRLLPPEALAWKIELDPEGSVIRTAIEHPAELEVTTDPRPDRQKETK